VLPVPDLISADASGRHCAYPYLVYRWIEGITLNECRRRNAPDALLTLAEPLGRLLATISSRSFPEDLADGWDVATRLAAADEQLRTGLARERLGGALADRLRDGLAGSEPLLLALEHDRGLVHGDFGGRNILVKTTANDEWEISGVLDWEEAAAGAAWWDIGSLFRYPRRYLPEFRGLFAHGYRAAGGNLPHDWWRTARLLDATRLVAVLNEERQLPGVFAESRELIESLSLAPAGTCQKLDNRRGGIHEADPLLGGHEP
jgi:aminoglycoside phosphotransferase (APT) family kinase protein